MKLRFLVSTFALALTTIVAHAQTGLYVNPIITRASNTVADSGSFAFLGQNSKSAIFGGVDIGAYYMFAHYTGFDVGVDVREEIQHANNAGLSSFMVAPRIAFKPVSYGLKPYAQVGFGAGRTHSGENSAHVTKLELAVTGGIDKPLGRFVDWRVVEVGYGSVSTISSAVYNGPTPVPAAKLLNFSAGLVFKIP